jgi:hypothetical protein
MSSSSYGVSYTPTTASAHWSAPALAALKAHGFRYIRLTWVDYANVVRYRVLPLKYFERVLASARPGASIPALAHLWWQEC